MTRALLRSRAGGRARAWRAAPAAALVAVAAPLVLAAALLVAASGCSRPVSGRVAVDVTEDGFVPATVHVRRGVPLTLVVTRRTDATCATRAEFATLGRGYDLPLGKPVAIPIPTDSARTIHYACPMDMYKGKVVVE